LIAALDRRITESEVAALRAGFAPVVDRRLFVARRGKVPYVAGGGVLSGAFASEAVQSKLMTLEDSIALADRGSFDGVGSAFYTGCGVAGVDLDHCVDPVTGKLNPTAEQREVLAMLVGKAYIETSMSGTGLHCFALGDAKTFKANGSVELFGDSNFIALTGRGAGVMRRIEPAAVSRVVAIVEHLRQVKLHSSAAAVAPTSKGDAPQRSRSTLNAEVLAPTPRPRAMGAEEPERIRSALTSGMPPRDRDAWMRLVWAIRDGLGEAGLDVAREWSMRDPDKFSEDGFSAVWHSDKAPAGGVTVASLYAWAKGNGWVDAARSASEDEARPTDLALANLFVKTEGGGIRFDHAAKVWLQDDGQRWAKCSRGEEVERFKRFAGSLMQAAGKALAAEPESPKVKRLQACATRAQSANGIQAGLSLAQSDPAVAVTSEQFDRAPDLFNTASGVVHLPSGQLRPHDPALLLQRRSPVRYEPGAECPQFDAFMAQVSCGDPDWVDYMQRQLGYVLSGYVREEKMFFWFGDGRNGKSVLANVIRHIAGDYSAVAPAAMFMRSRRDGGSATPELAMLPGVRLLLANETESGARLSAQTFKVAVSTERIAARSLYGSPFSFAPTHKVVMRGNHLPIITEGDEGTWRRIDLVPFDLKLAPEECDPHLEAKLLTEERGILRWMVEGCVKWHSDGLKPPRRVRDAGLKYRKNSDVIAQWVDDFCDVGVQFEVAKTFAYTSFRQWCVGEGLRPLSKKALTQMLAERGVEGGRESVGARLDVYQGIRLKAQK